jgi:HAMP domain.
MALVALLGLLAGLTAFGLITRPLRRLTDAMRRFDAEGEPDTQPSVPRSSPPDAATKSPCSKQRSRRWPTASASSGAR